MRIIFVRHGHPDYQNDCLTELGHRHAEAAAQRLSGEKIDKIYASSCGRAYETAKHIAAPHRLPVEKVDFMREIGWGFTDDDLAFQGGNPWFLADDMVARGQSVIDFQWAEKEPFSRNYVVERAQKAAENFDQWLAALGYERDGLYYRVRSENRDTVAMVSHAGASSAVFAHLFNLPFSFLCAAARPDFTAISVISFDGKEGNLISPAITLLNDARHIAGLKNE